MIRRTSIGLVSALLALSLAPAARAGTVSGRVLDSGGAPVAGVRVSWEAYRTDEQTLVDETKGVTAESLGATTTDAAGRFTLRTVRCLGLCALSPAMRINGQAFARVDLDKVPEILEPFE